MSCIIGNRILIFLVDYAGIGVCGKDHMSRAGHELSSGYSEEIGLNRVRKALRHRRETRSHNIPRAWNSM